jgi:hypothetical protein
MSRSKLSNSRGVGVDEAQTLVLVPFFPPTRLAAVAIMPRPLRSASHATTANAQNSLRGARYTLIGFALLSKEMFFRKKPVPKRPDRAGLELAAVRRDDRRKRPQTALRRPGL